MIGLPPLFAAPAVAGASVAELLLVLVTIFIATKLLGEAAQRIGQPAVLGELIAGVILGGSVLGFLDPADPVIHIFAEIGVMVLLFEIGLHTDLRALIRVGRVAGVVGIVGLTLPFAGGYFVAIWLNQTPLVALVCGAALTATSIGISARVLSDLGRLDSKEGQVVLGAAVLDDVVGLIILSVVAGIVGGEGITMFGVAKTAGIALGFVVVALLVGGVVAPPVFKFVDRIRTAGALGLIALAFAFAMAALASIAGSALIIGAFAAGLVLHNTPQRFDIERSTTAIGHFFVPIFFAAVGASVELSAFGDPDALLVGGALIVVGILGKVAAGYAPFWFTGNKLLVGVAMVPRGEVGLIFAQMGLASGAIGADIFGALMLMVLATTFITPPLLGKLAKPSLPPDYGDQPGDGGIDDLVAGASRAADEEVRLE